MAKKPKMSDLEQGGKFEVVNPNAAGIDISTSEMQVCVPEDRDGDNNRTFGAFTEDLHLITEWLRACNIDTVAMESTGFYWQNLFRILVKDGFDVYLVNPNTVKGFTDKKTDKNDAFWLMIMHRHGLLHNSFHVHDAMEDAKNLLRFRQTLVRKAAELTQIVIETLELLNVKLANVVRDIMGTSGTKMIKAIIAGERNPQVLAAMADSRCKNSQETIAKSLVGNWNQAFLFQLKQSMELYDTYQERINALDKEVEKVLSAYTASSGKDLSQIPREAKSRSRKNGFAFDSEKYAYAIFGVNVIAIPGFNNTSALQMAVELGPDFTDKFPTAEAFSSWCRVVPNNKISGGKILSSHLMKGRGTVGQLFLQCATSLWSNKGVWGQIYRRASRRKGGKQAQVYCAHKLAKIFYTIVKAGKPYDESKLKSEDDMLRKIAHAKKMLAQYEQEYDSIYKDVS